MRLTNLVRASLKEKNVNATFVLLAEKMRRLPKQTVTSYIGTFERDGGLQAFPVIHRKHENDTEDDGSLRRSASLTAACLLARRWTTELLLLFLSASLEVKERRRARLRFHSNSSVWT